MKGFIDEFKAFALTGNLIDMATGIIIGAAVTAMVGSLVDDIIMPIVGAITGGINFAGLAFNVGDAAIGYGNFIQAVIKFIIIAFVIFLIIKAINNLKKKSAEEEQAKEEPPPADIQLLTEIRDSLKSGR